MRQQRTVAVCRGPTGTPQAIKRGFDLIVALVVLGLSAPVLVVCGLLVVGTSRGGALFRQVRLGYRKRPFVMYKFRTMVTGCSEDLHRDYVTELLDKDTAAPTGLHGLYKLDGDPRVTRVGRFLRRSSLDELPQLWNVVRGDMALVGPRPALPWEAERFGVGYDRRYLVRPGLTGLWQVSGRSRLTMRQGLALDVEYVDRQNFRLDLRILLKTIPAVLSLDGSP